MHENFTVNIRNLHTNAVPIFITKSHTYFYWRFYTNVLMKFNTHMKNLNLSSNAFCYVIVYQTISMFLGFTLLANTYIVIFYTWYIFQTILTKIRLIINNCKFRILFVFFFGLCLIKYRAYYDDCSKKLF